MFWHDKNIYYTSLLQYSDGLKLVESKIIALYKIIYDKQLENPKEKIIVFTSDKELLAKYTDENYETIVKKLIYKITQDYKNPKVKTKIIKIINEELHDLFKQFFIHIGDMMTQTNKILQILEKYKDTFIMDMLIKRKDGTHSYGISNTIFDYIIYIYKAHSEMTTQFAGATSRMGVYLMDLYVLRRVLDKNYVTNAISYTGAHHSLNYIRVLVKYFNFSITNCAYLNKDYTNTSAEKLKIDKHIPKYEYYTYLNKYV
jgi:hypothetical protein